MKVSAKQYFEWCHQLFQQRVDETDHCVDYFFSIGGRFTICIRFAGTHMISPFTRALAHLATDPVENPDLTVCVWDSASTADGVFLYPFGRDIESSKRHTISNIHISFDRYPSRISLFSPERNLALFWINDVKQFPWYEQCRPLRDIMHWWGLNRQICMVHAACVGTAAGGVLITGKPGAGKSTSALASLKSELSFVADDLCLIGLEEKVAFAYSLYNSAKLEHFELLPHLEQYVVNRDRPAIEKAFMYVNESVPEKLIKKVPLRAVVVPTITKEQLSSLHSLSSNEAFRILVASTSEELGGTSAKDFFVPYQVCKTTPCYSLASGTDLARLNDVLSTLLTEAGKDLMQVADS